MRFEVRNEYGIASPELFKKESAAGDDPKAVLQGVAVAGLVGILRQLGDLAEFAAEVFHGLQEQVTITSSRSHKLMSRVRRIETALPPLEKAVLAQKSHLHFAYTAGLYWHPRIRCEKNHFIYSDLPRFVMDSYEECRQPPRLHLLDKFDTGGPGSCLKRYSDPTIFMRASGKYSEPSVEKLLKIKKSLKIKKKKACRKNAPSKDASSASYNDRAYYASLDVQGKTSPSRSFSGSDVASRPNQWDLAHSLHSGNNSGYLDRAPESNYSAQYEEKESKDPASPLTRHHKHFPDYDSFDDKERVTYNSSNTLPHNGIGRVFSDIAKGSSEVENKSPSSYVACDENFEKVKHTSGVGDHDAALAALHCHIEAESTDKVGDDFEIIGPETIDRFVSENNCNDEQLDNANSVKDVNDREAVDIVRVHHIDFRPDDGSEHPPTSFDDQIWDIDSETENYMDALNTIESESETDLDYQTKREIEQYFGSYNKATDDDIDSSMLEHSNMHASNFCSDAASNKNSPREELIGSRIKDVDSDIQQANHVKLEKEAMAGEIEAIGSPNSDNHASDLVSDTTDRGSSHKVMFVNDIESRVSGSDLAQSNSIGRTISASNSISSEWPTVFQSSEMASGGDFNSDHQPDIDSCGQGHVTTDSIDQQLSSPGRGENFSEEHISQNGPTLATEPHKHPKESSTVTSIQFWTNGGLLGLEPSKPPDFSVANPAGHAASKFSFEQHAEESKVSQPSGYNNEDTSISNENDGENFTRWKISRRLPSADLDVRHHHLAGSTYETCSDISEKNGSKSHMVTSQDLNATYNENNSRSFSRMFNIGNKLLANGFHRELSLESDDCSDPSMSLDFDITEQKGHHSVKHQTYSGRFKDYYKNDSPTMSPSSSPLLGHMKISFQPVDRFENSELKLKFPNGNDSHESCRDIFPSFQLVPGHVVPLVDINSDSEADTFCRSSPYMSDDCLSRQSDSNSEIWESGESPVNKDHELYDALCRISLTESVSASLEPSRTAQGEAHHNPDLRITYAENSVGRSQSAHFSDLPSLHILSPSIRNDSIDQCKEKSLLKSYSLQERSPTPPPLPPMQWRTVKPNSDLAEENQHLIPVAPNYAYDMKISKSTISQQPKPAPQTQDKIVEAASMLRSKKLTGQTLSLQREADQLVHGSVTDGKDDFLHQIRTKSFNLRRTVTKTAAQSELPTNVKVTAIIEKANAIRKVVGSDDGDEDDNWSDI
ncbi:hypothetical protein Leryth_027131 [Lithospermum erythrorhizon]|nr:hypothetical protein Leryth_027131 [Lithospermum erythrorhizon]